ncbi:MAG: TIGR04255 family protein [bacterium]|nr:TIGR04255 family protein [bacterium]
MSDWPHLPKAPITEALIDIRAQLPKGTRVDDLSAFREKVKADYPSCRERRKWHGQFRFSATTPLTVDSGVDEPDGYLLTSPDGTQIVQARLDGFTFSRLKPYRDWLQLRATAQSLWDLYREVAQPVSVTRIAVRYINRLELPLPWKDYRDWVRTLPEIAPLLPQGLSGFLMRLNIPFEEPPGFVIVTQAVEPGDHSEYVPLIFDIDAFLLEDFDPGDQGFWHRFEDLREIKNRVFFESITDRTKELYL